MHSWRVPRRRFVRHGAERSTPLSARRSSFGRTQPADPGRRRASATGPTISSASRLSSLVSVTSRYGDSGSRHICAHQASRSNPSLSFGGSSSCFVLRAYSAGLMPSIKGRLVAVAGQLDRDGRRDGGLAALELGESGVQLPGRRHPHLVRVEHSPAPPGRRRRSAAPLTSSRRVRCSRASCLRHRRQCREPAHHFTFLVVVARRPKTGTAAGVRVGGLSAGENRSARRGEGPPSGSPDLRPGPHRNRCAREPPAGSGQADRAG